MSNNFNPKDFEIVEANSKRSQGFPSVDSLQSSSLYISLMAEAVSMGHTVTVIEPGSTTFDYDMSKYTKFISETDNPPESYLDSTIPKTEE